MHRWLVLLISVVLILGQSMTVPGAEISDTELYAKGACLMDGDSGRVLYGKQADIGMAMASTTKIMTCILALEQGELQTVVTASDKAAAAPKVHLGVKQGQTFLMENLLYALMLESFNDAAIMIAEGIGGSVEGFAAKMNDKAKEIGCADTYFVTPNGLDAADAGGSHHTTARDLALIMRYCITQSPKKEDFLRITQTASHSFWDCENQVFYNCNNHNTFLSMMDGALSGKTGFTAKAGYCYVGALQKDGKLLIVSVLACGWPNNKSYKWSDTRKLMTYGLENYQYRDIYQTGLLDAPVPVKDGQYAGRLGEDEAFGILTYKDGREAENPKQMLLKEEESVEVKADIPEKLQAPVKAGTQVGSVSYLLDGKKLVEYPVFLEKSVKKIDISWCMKRVFLVFCNKDQ
ncbi:D-alanyl-D-alanine carboxypeptidase family protein [Novisyntrophococcus fermenticellae]|uniref:D-alanyl-D-alanine carboxypeptidase family protein n=1 Tax=Novisyntrophococcus fermenticellae TaxID=2068655 RepID=UPI001E3DD0B7|nr:D-alanyl-D-alanine carboxypeptidase family protein [Novisyntrophococcus fermenticellae]